jgi:23S rRNA pseudouridine2605 synthase
MMQKLWRVQKLLAHFGYASRRTVEQWIKEGKIKINDKIATLADRVDVREDSLFLSNKRINIHQTIKPRFILYHKPVGEICSHADTHNRRTIFDTLPTLTQGRWIYIGRLDLNTSGLLLLTNDGDKANQLMHPSQFIEREYAVRTLGRLTDQMIKKLTHNVELDDGTARFKHIIVTQKNGANHWYRVVIMEGRHRLVRRLFESQGILVNRLIRIRFGHIILPRHLKPGHFKSMAMPI